MILNGDAALRKYETLGAWVRGDAEFSGTWSNHVEGLIDKVELATTEQRSAVVLQIGVHEGEITGTIYSGRFCEKLPWNEVQFTGEIGWVGASGTAFDYVAGRRIAFARFRMSLDREQGTLVLHASPESLLFPGQIELIRVSREGSVSGDQLTALCLGASPSQH